MELKTRNIIKGAEKNFEICNNCNDFGVPYDGSSIMHYSMFGLGRWKTAGGRLITMLSKVKLLVFYNVNLHPSRISLSFGIWKCPILSIHLYSFG